MINGIGAGCVFPTINNLRAAGTPALSLDFLNPSLDSRITFSRASGGTRVNSAGLIETLTTDQPRFDYDPVTLAPKGLLIEESRTNLQTYSQDLASWGTKTSISFGADGVSPAGITEADYINTTAGTDILDTTNVTVVAGSTNTYSVYIKIGAGSASNWVRFGASGAGLADGCELWIDLSRTGNTVWTTSGSQNGQNFQARGAGVATSASITQVGNGWMRVVMTGVCAPAGTVAIPFFTSAASDYTSTRVAGTNYYLWGVQAEAGAFPTSYIPTTTAAVTRAADVASMTGTAFSSWFNATEGTFVVSGDNQGRTSANFINIISATTALDSNNRLSVYFNGDTHTVFESRVAGAGQATPSVSFSGSGGYKLAGGYAANNFNQATNGILGTLDAAGTVPTVDRLTFGTTSGANVANGTGHLQRITYYNKRLPDNTLKALSA